MRARSLAAALIALSLTACGGTAEAPRDQFYRLSVAAPQAGAAPVLNGTVEVERFLAEGLITERALLYAAAATPDRLLQYSYHHWTDAPPRMLQEQLVAYLRGVRAAGTVVTTEHRAEPDYIISAKVRRMEQLVGGGNPSVALSMELSVRRERDGQLVLIQVYDVERAAANRSMAGTVAAMNQALSALYGAFVTDLRGLKG